MNECSFFFENERIMLTLMMSKEKTFVVLLQNEVREWMLFWYTFFTLLLISQRGVRHLRQFRTSTSHWPWSWPYPPLATASGACKTQALLSPNALAWHKLGARAPRSWTQYAPLCFAKAESTSRVPHVSGISSSYSSFSSTGAQQPEMWIINKHSEFQDLLNSLNNTFLVLDPHLVSSRVILLNDALFLVQVCHGWKIPNTRNSEKDFSSYRNLQSEWWVDQPLQPPLYFGGGPVLRYAHIFYLVILAEISCLLK